MKKFKVLSGIHVEGEREYKAGDTLLSERPLSVMFFNKFEDLGLVQEEPPTPSTPAAPPEDEEDDEWEKLTPEPSKAKAKRKAPVSSRLK